jgi:hypothetical protein
MLTLAPCKTRKERGTPGSIQEKYFEIYFLVQVQGARLRGFSACHGVTQGCDDKHDRVRSL